LVRQGPLVNRGLVVGQDNKDNQDPMVVPDQMVLLVDQVPQDPLDRMVLQG